MTCENGCETFEDTCGACIREVKEERDRLLFQLSELQKKLVVGGMPVPGLVCVAEAPHAKALQELSALEEETKDQGRLIGEAQAWLGLWIDKIPTEARSRLQEILYAEKRFDENAGDKLHFPEWGNKRICECTSQGHAPGCEIGKPNYDAPHPLASKTQCGKWTQWGQCIAEKPCKAHG